MQQTYYYDLEARRWRVACVEIFHGDGTRTLLVYMVAGEPALRLQRVPKFSAAAGGWSDRQPQDPRICEGIDAVAAGLDAPEDDEPELLLEEAARAPSPPIVPSTLPAPLAPEIE